MEPIPARILRAYTEDIPGFTAPPTGHDLRQQNRIITAATALMARFTPAAISIPAFALAIRLPAAAIRRHFCDLDEVLATILRAHIQAIARALGEVAKDPVRRRAAYLDFTRTAPDRCTDAHHLLVHHRRDLPPDLRAEMDYLRQGLTLCADPAQNRLVLDLLDESNLEHYQIEAMIAARAAAVEPPATPLVPPGPDLQDLEHRAHRAVILSQIRAQPVPGNSYLYLDPKDGKLKSRPCLHPAETAPDAGPDAEPDDPIKADTATAPKTGI